MGELGMD